MNPSDFAALFKSVFSQPRFRFVKLPDKGDALEWTYNFLETPSNLPADQVEAFLQVLPPKFKRDLLGVYTFKEMENKPVKYKDLLQVSVPPSDSRPELLDLLSEFWGRERTKDYNVPVKDLPLSTVLAKPTNVGKKRIIEFVNEVLENKFSGDSFKKAEWLKKNSSFIPIVDNYLKNDILLPLVKEEFLKNKTLMPSSPEEEKNKKDSLNLLENEFSEELESIFPSRDIKVDKKFITGKIIENANKLDAARENVLTQPFISEKNEDIKKSISDYLEENKKPTSASNRQIKTADQAYQELARNFPATSRAYHTQTENLRKFLKDEIKLKDSEIDDKYADRERFIIDQALDNTKKALEHINSSHTARGDFFSSARERHIGNTLEKLGEKLTKTLAADKQQFALNEVQKERLKGETAIANTLGNLKNMEGYVDFYKNYRSMELDNLKNIEELEKKKLKEEVTLTESLAKHEEDIEKRKVEDPLKKTKEKLDESLKEWMDIGRLQTAINESEAKTNAFKSEQHLREANIDANKRKEFLQTAMMEQNVPQRPRFGEVFGGLNVAKGGPVSDTTYQERIKKRLRDFLEKEKTYQNLEEETQNEIKEIEENYPLRAIASHFLGVDPYLRAIPKIERNLGLINAYEKSREALDKFDFAREDRDERYKQQSNLLKEKNYFDLLKEDKEHSNKLSQIIALNANKTERAQEKPYKYSGNEIKKVLDAKEKLSASLEMKDLLESVKNANEKVDVGSVKAWISSNLPNTLSKAFTAKPAKGTVQDLNNFEALSKALLNAMIVNEKSGRMGIGLAKLKEQSKPGKIHTQETNRELIKVLEGEINKDIRQSRDILKNYQENKPLVKLELEEEPIASSPATASNDNKETGNEYFEGGVRLYGLS